MESCFMGSKRLTPTIVGKMALKRLLLLLLLLLNFVYIYIFSYNSLYDILYYFYPLRLPYNLI